MPGSVAMETEADVAVKSRDTEGSAGVNGTGCNGASTSEDGEQSNSSQQSSVLSDKIKDGLDGFKIVTRNGHKEEDDLANTNGSLIQSEVKNGVNGIENTDTCSMESSVNEVDAEEAMDTGEGEDIEVSKDEPKSDEKSPELSKTDVEMFVDENSMDTSTVEKDDNSVDTSTVEKDENSVDTSIIEKDDNSMDTSIIEKDENSVDTSIIEKDENSVDTSIIEKDENSVDTSTVEKDENSVDTSTVEKDEKSSDSVPEKDADESQDQNEKKAESVNQIKEKSDVENHKSTKDEKVAEEKSEDKKVTDGSVTEKCQIESSEPKAAGSTEKSETDTKKTPPPLHDSRLRSAAPVSEESLKSGEKTKEKTTKPSKVDRVLADDKGTGGAANTGSENLRPFARQLFDLGLDLSRQHVYKDLIKVQKKKQSHNKLGEKEEEQLEKLKEAYDHLLDKNEAFMVDSAKCRKCNYKSDSLNVLELHKEYEHKGACAFCDFVTGNVHSFYFHMEAEHNRQGRVQPIVGQYVCPFCPFENHSAKKTFYKHIGKCEAAFKLSKNLQPMPSDCDIALKAPPPSHMNRPPVRPPPPLQKRPEVRPASTPRPAAPPAIPQSVIMAGLRPAGNQTAMTGLPPWLNIAENQGPQLVQVGNQYFLVVTQNGQTFMTPMMAGAGQTAVPKPSPAKVPVTPAVQAPPKPAAVPTVNKDKFEICEICGGFVKDRDALRIHFFWAHKIEIHPTVMKGRDAAIKCQQCPQRFWTYQGYRRHTSVSHPSAKPSQRGIVCYVCGNPVPDFITHMTSAHPTVVKNMLGQMRCVVCQDAFPSESALETHMLMDHKDVVTQYGSVATAGGKPNKAAAATEGSTAAQVSGSPVPTGIFPNSGSNKSPTKCSRCSFQYTSPAAYKVHFNKSHSSEEEPCLLCKEDIFVGSKTIEHIEKNHLKKVTIPIKRLSEDVVSKYAVPRKRKNSDEVIVIDLDRSEKTPRKEDISENKENITEDRKENKTENKDLQPKGKEDATDKEEVVMDLDSEDSKGGDTKKKVKDVVIKDKVIEEEIIEVDGEQVLVQKLDDDDDDDDDDE